MLYEIKHKDAHLFAETLSHLHLCNMLLLHLVIDKRFRNTKLTTRFPTRNFD